MDRLSVALRGFVVFGFVFSPAACSSEATGPTDTTAVAGAGGGGGATGGGTSGLSASIRLRCENGAGRSKISVDGNNLTPRNGLFRARVSASGGTITSPEQRAVGDEAEFDFDSNPNDVAQGATPIPATFAAAQSGPDVVGEILDAQGQVVVSQGVECSFR
jgi:hypothetical protein